MIAGVTIVIGALAHAYSPSIVGDDAYIAFRYAQNLARGRGLVFNPDERVWGFSSPLHTLLLGILAALGIDIPAAAAVLGFLAMALTALCWWYLLADLVAVPLRIPLLLLACTVPDQLTFFGLETSLLVLIESLFLLLLLRRDRPLLTALVGSAACLTRPDAVLLVLPCLLLGRRTRTWRALLVFVAPGLAWEAFTLLYYHALLPATFYGKRGQSGFVEFVTVTLREWGHIGAAITPPAAFVIVPVLTLVVLVVPAVRRSPPLAWALVVYPWLLFLAYALMRPPLKHTWEYFVGHLFQFYGLCALAGYLVKRVVDRLRRPALRSGVLTLVASILALALVEQTRYGTRELEELQHSFWSGARNQRYHEIGPWLRERVPEDAKIWSNEVGMLAYLSDRRFIDRYRLTTPPLARQRPQFLLVFGNRERGTLNGATYTRTRFFPGDGFTDLSFLERDPR
jgi:hypothetical protein